MRESLDGEPLTDAGQMFRMAMYHENHPDKDYEMANRVEVFDPPRAIAWQPGPGVARDRRNSSFGGWIWRYDLEPVGVDRDEVTLTYDWSAVPPQLREHIQFPPFDAAAPRQLAAASGRAGAGTRLGVAGSRTASMRALS